MTGTHTKTQVKAALLHAADWLEANRDKHIAGRIGRDAQGKRVADSMLGGKGPISDAVCMCANGALALQLDPATHNAYETVGAALRGVGIVDGQGGTYEPIYGVNDKFFDGQKTLCFGEMQGNPKVIPFLRQMAKGIRDE